jgi:magnesium chelatase family protein
VPAAQLLADVGTLAGELAESSTVVRARVAAVRARTDARQGCNNAVLDPAALDAVATLTAETRRLLSRAAEQLGLSARGCLRVRRVARTIADLAGSDPVDSLHLAEALSLRGGGST